MTETQPLQRSRLYWQCRRGMLELDILLQEFYQAHVAESAKDSLNDSELAVFADLLVCSDEQLYAYLMGRIVASDTKLAAMVDRIRKNVSMASNMSM